MSDIDSADDDGKSNDDPNDLFKHTACKQYRP
jgi:hypothetical protein